MTVSRHGPEFNPEHIYREAVDAAFHGVQQAVLTVEAEWKRVESTHRRTGNSLRHITHSFTRTAFGGEGEVGTDLRSARYREEGTGIYGPKHRRIVPLRAQALSWVGGKNATLAGRQRKGTTGGRVFFRSVAGIRPQHVFEDALRVAAPKLDRVAEQTDRHILAAMTGGR